MNEMHSMGVVQRQQAKCGSNMNTTDAQRHIMGAVQRQYMNKMHSMEAVQRQTMHKGIVWEQYKIKR